MKNSNMFRIASIPRSSLTVGSILIFLALGCSQVFAGNRADEKCLNLRVRDSSFKVNFTPLKPSYKVGEAIKFYVRANRDFFLYLYSINERERRAVLLIPGIQQKHNKYKANRTYLVPNPNLEFYADRGGVERIVMVASTRFLDLQTDHYVKSGGFFSVPARVAESQIKDLRIRPIHRSTEERVIRELSLHILDDWSISGPSPMCRSFNGSEGSSETGSCETKVFLHCEENFYEIGEQVRIVYGADRSGWVSLYVIEPTGQKVLLQRRQVIENVTYHLTAVASLPAGQHTLVAAFSRTNQFPEMPILTTTEQMPVCSSILSAPPSATCCIHIAV